MPIQRCQYRDTVRTIRSADAMSDAHLSPPDDPPESNPVPEAGEGWLVDNHCDSDSADWPAGVYCAECERVIDWDQIVADFSRMTDQSQAEWLWRFEGLIAEYKRRVRS